MSPSLRALVAEVLHRVPGRNAGRGNRPGDPLNLLIVGKEEAVRAALRGAGWTEVPRRLRDSVRQGLGELARGLRLARFPPFNVYRLGGRTQDMNWARPVRALHERHHFRLWRLPWRDESGRELWWGSANYDLKLRWRDLSHVPHPDTDLERDFVASTLAGSGWVEAAFLTPLPQVPRHGTNDKGYPFLSDGRVLTVVLASPQPS